MATETRTFPTGAVRSADADDLDFVSLPLIGLIAVARTAAEGGTKYGRYNYMLGMPAHECVNHAMRHLILWAAGDRSEPHLAHAGWNILAAEQSMVLDPDLNAPHLLGPGATLTPAVRAHLLAGKPDRDARRARGEFRAGSEWTTEDLPEVAEIVWDRLEAQSGERRVPLGPGPVDPPLAWGPEDDDLAVEAGAPICGHCFTSSACLGGPLCKDPRPPVVADAVVELADPAPRRDPEKILYLSGPMTGFSEENFPAFFHAADRLRIIGYEVLNPADFGADPSVPWAECLARDVLVMLKADRIVTLPGWEMSLGASLEVRLGGKLGIPMSPLASYFEADPAPATTPPAPGLG